MPQQDCHPVEGIEAIAARIHDRAVQLAEEQESLRKAEQELSKTQEVFVKEKERRRCVRMEFLKRMSQANALELECIRFRERISIRMLKTKQLKEKEKELASFVLKNTTLWNKSEDALSRHKLLQELYLKVTRGVVNNRNEHLARRQSRIEMVVQLCEKVKLENESCKADQNRIQEHFLRLVETEDEENTAVERLASQVREAIARRSELRSLLRDSHQKFQDTRTEVDRAGYEYRSSQS